MQPYEMLWRTDENGIPMSIAIEEQFIVGNDLYLVLEEIPDSYQRVSISTEEGRIYESMNRNQLTTNRFYVDYNNGIVYFDSSLLGKALTINYYGRGYKRINASRIIGLENIIVQPTSEVETEETFNKYEERLNAMMSKNQILEKQIDFLVEEMEKLIKQGGE